MRMILGLFFLSVSLPLLANTRKITTQIHSVDYGNPGEEVLVFLMSGDVARATEANLEMIEDVQEAKSNSEWLTLTLDKDRHILSVDGASAPVAKSNEKDFDLDGIDSGYSPYVPTTLPNMSTAKAYIAESRSSGFTENSQCFNRAHVWVYEWWKKHSFRSQKVFVFWKKEYVRKYNFEWWFHVSPYAHVMDDDGVVKERVLDVKWLSRPYKFQEWVDYHQPKDVDCKVVGKYSDYANNPYGHDCYLIRTNMFTWQPVDLELYEAWGERAFKRAFNLDEVRSAYLQAFGVSL